MDTEKVAGARIQHLSFWERNNLHVRLLDVIDENEVKSHLAYVKAKEAVLSREPTFVYSL